MNNENRHFNMDNTAGIDDATLTIMNDLWEEATEDLNQDEHSDRLDKINLLLLKLVDAA